MLNSSPVAWSGNLTLRVMGGKSGKKRQGGWQEVARPAAKAAPFWGAAGVCRAMRRPVRVGEVGMFGSRCGCSGAYGAGWTCVNGTNLLQIRRDGKGVGIAAMNGRRTADGV